MSYFLMRLSLLSAMVLGLLATGTSFAASTANTANLFELSELPSLATGHAVELAAKCGTGACSGKEAGATATKDAKHSCAGKEAAHKCATKKNVKHKFGTTKDAAHKCATKKDGTQKCGTSSCASKTTKP